MPKTRKRVTNTYILLVCLFLVITLFVLVFNNQNKEANDTYNNNFNIEDIGDSFSIYPSKEEAMSALNNINIEEAKNTEYHREEQFGSWKEYSGWSTRDEVLSKFGEDTENNGRVFTYGNWYVLYNNTYYSFDNKEDISSNLEIDHIVPLSYAYKHGADNWEQDKREEFCNDYGEDTKWTSGSNNSFDYDNGYYGNLIVSDKRSNRSKSDKGPSEWLPESNLLTYAEMWIDICNKYDVSITEEDYNTLRNILESA